MSLQISKAARAVLESLEARNRLNPEVVFETAKKDKQSPLRGYFVWDEKRAAYLHNIEIAKSMIRTVRITQEVVDRGTVRNINVPAYLSDPGVRGEYRTVESVIGSRIERDVYDDVLNEVASAEGHLKRALAVGLTLGFGDDIRRVIASVAKLKVDVEAARPPKRPRPTAGGETRPTA